jgi:hypothetical protein
LREQRHESFSQKAALPWHHHSRSEKEDKRRTNRTEHRLNRQILYATVDDTLLRNKRKVDNPWLSAKDGENRFDPKIYPALVRK